MKNNFLESLRQDIKESATRSEPVEIWRLSCHIYANSLSVIIIGLAGWKESNHCQAVIFQAVYRRTRPLTSKSLPICL